ncbi:hypothetical protein AXG93_2947s1000 [Marchantia polymorpha subsp. ruderalis]|uniref:Uncharacterized protein n=1 Tax=Marchantia polymorpha subsp. ruderalis TaxID=1480154 RepID=A0A176WRL6_MARPO|nr:hypothetical protein AXG93_2947s1000 [Marchantia polymorpha subsp. ruderalis]
MHYQVQERKWLQDRDQPSCIRSDGKSVTGSSYPGRYVKDVEVDTNKDETPACTPPAQPRAEEEPRAARVPRKQKWDGEAE